MAKKNTVEFTNVTVITETDKALLVAIDGEQHWIPLSQIDDDSEIYRAGTTGTLIVTEWIAKQKGLI